MTDQINICPDGHGECRLCAEIASLRDRAEREIAALRDRLAEIESRSMDEAKSALLDEFRLLSMHYNHATGGEIAVASPFVGVLCEWVRRDLGDAENFLVQQFSIAGKCSDGERHEFVVTLQRRGKLTPADRYLDVCKDRDAIAEALAAMTASRDRLKAMAISRDRMDIARVTRDERLRLEATEQFRKARSAVDAAGDIKEDA